MKGKRFFAALLVLVLCLSLSPLSGLSALASPAQTETCVVKFYLMPGWNPETNLTQQVEKGKTANKPADPEDPLDRDWAFGGWYTDPDYTNLFDFDTPVTENISLYAKWLETCSVILYLFADDTDPLAGRTVIKGQPTVPQEDPVQVGKVFGGWYTEKECINLFDFSTPIYENISLYGKWTDASEPEMCRVSWYLSVDSELPVVDVDVEKGQTISAPEDPGQEGYVFGGWYTDKELTHLFDFSTPITENIKLYAKWTDLEYCDVVFYLMPGWNPEPKLTQTVEAGKTASKPADPSDPLDRDWAFGGWYTDPDCTNLFDFDTPVTGNTSLYAKWLETCTVFLYYFADDPEPFASRDVIKGQPTVPQEDPAQEGKVFGGWYTERECTNLFDFSTPIYENISLYGKWTDASEPEMCRVSWYLSVDSELPVVDVDVEKGQTISAPEDPGQEGYVFGGWYTDKELTHLFDFSTPITKNIKLYAKWTPEATAKPSISGAEIKLSKTSYTYDGKAKKPGVTVTLGGKKLTKGTDYKVKYSDNIGAGTATVKVIGIGGYAGEAKATFKIKKAANEITASNKYASYSTTARKVALGASATGGDLTYESSISGVKVTKAGKVKLPAKFSGTVKITITAAGDNYKTATKTVKVIVPSAPVISSVKNSGTKKITVKWNKVSGVSGYQIQIAKNKNFKSAKSVDVAKAGTVSKTISKLAKNQTYYVRIRSYKTFGGKTYYSAWSARKSVKVKK